MALITVAQAKAHLRMPGVPDDDPDLLQKMAAAEAAILTYINTTDYWRSVSVGWTDETTTPADVQHAILTKLAEMDRYRGDDVQGQGAAYEATSDMSPEITRLLRRWRDPVLA
jgi:hypothetical protein